MVTLGFTTSARPFAVFIALGAAALGACTETGAPPATGGAPTSSGGAQQASGGSASGGASGGGPSGGAPNVGGGELSSGGAAVASGGAVAMSGGQSSAAGGASQAGGASGVGGAAAADPCAQTGVLLCETFESHGAGTAPGAPWESVLTGDSGAITVDDSTPAHGGSHSLSVSSGANYQTFAAITGAPVFPAPTPSLYARVYLRLGAPMTSGHNTYFKAGAAGASSSDNETRIGVMMGMLMINQPDQDRGVLSNQNYWTDQQPGVVFEPNVWTCIEGFFDPENSTVQFWVNGIDVPDLHLTDWQQDPLGAFHFGFEQYAGPAAEVWYDDIVISTNPIGCTEPSQ